MSRYFEELELAMQWLAIQPDTIFLGQSVRYPGTAMYRTLDKVVPMEKRLEMPVAEEMQMGISTGLALQGFTPISIYPRWDFLLLATNQIVNHLDKIPLMSENGYQPKVIIRTGIGSITPLNPQWQHRGDYTQPFQEMCKTIRVVLLEHAEQILPFYMAAYNRKESTILVEVSDFLNKK